VYIGGNIRDGRDDAHVSHEKKKKKKNEACGL